MSAPPGWYPDAQGVTRWWDGAAWTDHVQPAVPSQSEPTQPIATQGWTPMPPMPPMPRDFGDAVDPTGAPAGATAAGEPRSSTPVVVGLAVVIVLLLAAVIAVIALLATRDQTPAAQVSSAPVAVSPSSASSSSPSSPASPTAPDGAGSPAAVTQGFFDALLKGDCAGAQRYVTGADLTGAGACDPSAFPTDLLSQVNVTVGEATVDGDSATVPVHLVPDVPGVDAGSLGLPTLTARLTRVDGAWKLTGVG